MAMTILCCSTSVSLAEKMPLPVIDMHLHAIPVDYGFLGAPPHTICAPYRVFPTYAPGENYLEIFAESGRDGKHCDDPVVSPLTNEDSMRESLRRLEKYNIYGVTSGPFEFVEKWKKAAPDRIIPAVSFFLSQPQPLEEIRALHAQGRLKVFGEVAIQYEGITPDDERFEPYLALAEELDMPVGIHIGTGPPGAPYLGSPEYRGRLHSPLNLEDPLIKHPNLRLYVMHGGYPMLDDTLVLLYSHPQVYIEIGVIVWLLPRAEFYRYLKTIVNAGYGNRIMFGTDQMVWPGTIERSLDVIESADFLSDKQKRDILYNNAARFLRLPQEEIDRHHGRNGN